MEKVGSKTAMASRLTYASDLELGATAAPMEKFTNVCVNIATFAFIIMQVPQLVDNYREFFGSDPCSHFSRLAWGGFASGGLGNLLLCSYFASQKEWAAVRIQAFGAATSFMVIIQIRNGGCDPSVVPTVPYYVLATVMTIGLILPIMKACGAVPEKIFGVWQEASTAIGVGALIFSIFVEFKFIFYGQIAGLAGSTIMVLLLLFRPPALMPFIGALSGWLATFLFMFMPIPQVLKNMIVLKDIPSGILHGAAYADSIGSLVLGTLGNMLCIPRAFYTKDAVWFTGATWGVMFGGWLRFATMVLSGEKEWFALWIQYLILISVSVIVFVYWGLLIKFNGHAHNENFGAQFKFLWKTGEQI